MSQLENRLLAPFLFRGPKFLPLVFASLATKQVKAILFVVYPTKIAYKQDHFTLRTRHFHCL
jgi:hypothetical protein